MRAERCKGFRDLSPEEMERFRFVEQSFRDCCLGWGFREVRTPTLEYFHLFTSAGTLTPGMLSKVYSFLDWDGWSGQRVVLRPDGTIPVARFYIDNMADRRLARLFYVTNIFRFEEAGEEARERWQGGVELIGVSSPVADLELIVMSLSVLARLGIKDVRLCLSHAGLIRSLLSGLKLSPREQARVFDQILDGDTEALARIKSEKPKLGKALTSLLDLKGKSSSILRDAKALFNHHFPELEPHIDNLISVVAPLEALGYPFWIDIASGRGFEYYTGVIFQLFVAEDKVGGGGRYDALIPLMGGGDIPASGFALYFDHLVDLVAPSWLLKPLAPRVLIKSESAGLGQGLDIASRLREAGYVAELWLGGPKAAGFAWLIEVNDKAPRFTVTSHKNQKFEFETAGEVLGLLGGGNAGQDSVT